MTPAIVVCVLLCGIGLALGCGQLPTSVPTSGDTFPVGPAATLTISSTVAERTPASEVQTTSTAAVDTTTVSPADPRLLVELPVLAPDNIALVDLRPQVDDEPPPIRILSPALHAAEIAFLLSAYRSIVLQPALQTPTFFKQQSVVLHMTDGSALQVFFGRPDEPVSLMYSDERLAQEVGGDHDQAYRWAVGSAPEFVVTVQDLLEKTTPVNDKDSVLPSSMPADFGFIAGYWMMAQNVVDTFAGTFTKDMVLPQATTATASLRLSSEELADLYRDLVKMEILDYPSDFGEPKSTTGPTTYVTPHTSYYLLIVAAGIKKEVHWEDFSYGSWSSPQADALRNWFKKLRELIQARPEYKALPEARGGYA